MGVGEFLGKLFGGNDAGKNVGVLRAYGKLPMYAEYRRLEVSPGAPTQYSQWMDAGRLAWVRSPRKSEHGVTRPTRLMFRLPDAKEVVVASLWDSRDSLGRVFPFSFFVVCPTDALGGNSLERWAAAVSIFGTLDRAHQELGRLTAGGDFYRLYGKRAVLLRPDDLEQRASRLLAEAQGIQAPTWYQSVMGDNAALAGDWFGGLLRRVERWKSQPNQLADLALSCPLAPGVSPAAQAALWISWLEELAKKAGRSIDVVLPSDAEAPSSFVTLLLRHVLPDDFQLATTDAERYEFVERLSAATTPAEQPAEKSAEAVPMATPSGSLLDWVMQNGS